MAQRERECKRDRDTASSVFSLITHRSRCRGTSVCDVVRIILPRRPVPTRLQLSVSASSVDVFAVVSCGSLLQFASLNVSLKSASAGGHLAGHALGVCGHCQRHYNVAADNVLFPDVHPVAAVAAAAAWPVAAATRHAPK